MGAAAPQGLTRRARVWLVAAAVLGAVVLVWLVFVRIDTQSFRARSEAMAPTIELNQRFTVNKEAYDDAEVQRRDIVVLHPPEGAIEPPKCARMPPARQMCDKPRGGAADVQFVKRVIGLPGERIALDDGKAVIDGQPVDEPYANVDACGAGLCTFRSAITIPEDHYFLMGDNRGASDDSRFWGPVPRDQFVGRVDDCSPFGLRCEEDHRTG